MPSLQQGSIRLFRFSGIDVFLNWSWFVVGWWEINANAGLYSSITWNVLEYLALFAIVLTHEFGHALACRSVGGTANRIMLWPFGGVAYVDPPQRPGATLWSIVAGPLVNVVLYPILLIIFLSGQKLGWAANAPNLYQLVYGILWIDGRLLIFNILPVYPLDGGKILWSLLWFVMGRARALMTASIIGFFGVAGFILYAIHKENAWLGAISLYLVTSCWSGFQQARSLLRFAKLPRRDGFACPSCKVAPPVGNIWKCAHCGQGFDTFATQAVCPWCGTQYPVTKCLDCGEAHPMNEWAGSAVASRKF
jgi:Zn-dependent protease